MASTFAGNLTLLGSVANIIVAEHARGLGFWQHLRIGLLLAVVTTALGTAWLWLCSGCGPEPKSTIARSGCAPQGNVGCFQAVE